MSIARKRRDLKGHGIPLEGGDYLHSEERFPVHQPDFLDDAEFNVIIIRPDTGKVDAAMSIDLDFV
jgi:hypothetical protein